MIVYIASPYSLGDQMINIRNVILIADKLITMGHIPYIPHLTGFWHLISPKPHQFWMEYDRHFLCLCNCVLRLDGESNGADNEMRLAKELGIPVYYSLEELE